MKNGSAAFVTGCRAAGRKVTLDEGFFRAERQIDIPIRNTAQMAWVRWLFLEIPDPNPPLALGSPFLFRIILPIGGCVTIADEVSLISFEDDVCLYSEFFDAFVNLVNFGSTRFNLYLADRRYTISPDTSNLSVCVPKRTTRMSRIAVL